MNVSGYHIISSRVSGSGRDLTGYGLVTVGFAAAALTSVPPPPWRGGGR